VSRNFTNECRSISLRIIVRSPPHGVRFALQRGPTATAELVPPTRVSGDSLVFEMPVRLGAPRRGAKLRFLGPYVHGTPDSRFLYINSGEAADDPGSCWSRRAKVWLKAITSDQVEAMLEKDGGVLEAEIEGTGKDGGPVCASTNIIGEWRVSFDRLPTSAVIL
jgi:Family of unknown function (DUF5990)